MSDPFDLDAKLANRVSITMNADGMRVSFGEALPKPNPEAIEQIRYHTTVFLPGVVGLGLRDLLTEVILQHEIQLKPN